jgi:hypothetical protein
MMMRRFVDGANLPKSSPFESAFGRFGFCSDQSDGIIPLQAALDQRQWPGR